MCASKKKKREKETQQKEKHQTTNKKDATTDHGKTRYDNQVCYGPMRHTYRIHRYAYVDEKTKYVAKEGAQGTTPHAKKKKKERRTATHVKRHARKHKPQPYIPDIYSSIGPDRREKKKNPQKRKRYGAATDKGETMKRRTRERSPTTRKQRYGEQVC